MAERTYRKRVATAIGRVGGCCILLVSLSACTAEQTQQARAPEVDVAVEPGQWPRYKVNWADVDVGTRERTITVPIVTV